MYQNNVCYKYNKILEKCAEGQLCENGKCISSRETAITGQAVKEVESEGFFSRIINWIKSLF